MTPSSRPSPLICLVTDRHALAPDARTSEQQVEALERFLDDAIGAGVDQIQIRERDLDAAVLHGLVSRLVRRAAGSTSRIVVNDRADVAVAAGAHGLHLRGDGPSSSRVRGILPPGMAVGRSIHAPDEAGEDADYFIFGTVFPSGTKPAAGTERLAEVVRRTRVPVMAIGGVTPENLRACRDAGAAGAAAITVFLPPGCAPSALGPAAAVAAFRAAWNQAPGTRNTEI